MKSAAAACGTDSNFFVVVSRVVEQLGERIFCLSLVQGFHVLLHWSNIMFYTLARAFAQYKSNMISLLFFYQFTIGNRSEHRFGIGGKEKRKRWRKGMNERTKKRQTF